MQPKSKEAAAKLKASEKLQKEAAFAAAIMTDADVPLAEEINPDEIGERKASFFPFSVSSPAWVFVFFAHTGVVFVFVRVGVVVVGVGGGGGVGGGDGDGDGVVVGVVGGGNIASSHVQAGVCET